MSGKSSLGTKIVMGGAATAAAAFVVLATMKVGTLATIGVSTILLVAATLLARPDVGTFLFLALAYTNGIVLIGGAVGDATIVGAGFSGLLAVPVFVHVFVKREKWLFDYPFLLMIAFGGAVLLSTIVAKDTGRALTWVMTFALEGLLLYFLILNAIRKTSTLRQVMWVVAFVGGMMGSMAIYQELTGSYDQDFGGIMKRNTSYGYEDQGLDDGVVREREKVRVAQRAGGPTGGPNRCAQILLTMFPLALLLIWSEKRGNAKFIAGAFAALNLAGVLLTYSRGGFLSLCALVVLLLLFGYLRPGQVLVGAIVLFFMVAVIAPGYIGRIESVTGLGRFTSEAEVEGKQGDSTIRGRLTEMLAALHVFLDYPILGVGPSQYSPFYSLEYMANPDIQFRHIESTRRAHILYFELAAETGILGLGLFMTIAGVILTRLVRLRRQLRHRHPPLAHMATGFFLSIMMYFGTAVFLHFSYQRYFWISLALAGVAARLIQLAGSQPSEDEEAAAAAWLADTAEPEPVEAVGSMMGGKRPPVAVVVGMDNATGLQSARILAAHGVPVIGIASDPDHFCCRTRACERILAADITTDELVRTLETLGSSLSEKAVLYPCTDLSVLVVSRNRERLAEHYHVLLSDADVVEMLVDKVTFYTWAAEHGLPIPNTFFLKSRFDAETAGGHLEYPCILKPPIRTPAWARNSKDKVIKIESADHLLQVYDRVSGWAEMLMVQDWVEGSDETLWSCNCYFDAESEPLVTFIARKIRQWPPATGTACISVEDRNDEVLEETVRLFRKVGYRGLGYVEMKRDSRTGKHYIIEPNIGRPTGRSAIAEAGGVELLYTMYCDAVGWPLPENRVQTYRGVKWISLRRDVLSSLWYARRGELGLRDWWRSVRGRKGYAVWSWRDPAPFLGDLARSIRLLARKDSKAAEPAPVEAEQPVS